MDAKKPHYRKYTEEFKLEALKLLKSSGKSASQIERDLGITPGLLVKWRDRYQVITQGEIQAHRRASSMWLRNLQATLISTICSLGVVLLKAPKRMPSRKHATAC